MRSSYLLAAIVMVLLVPGVAQAELRSCKAVKDPYPNTRYAQVDLTRIKTTLQSCSKARRVARKAHWKALKLQPVGGRKVFIWNGWSVDGNVKPDHDRYVARKDGRQVRWRF